ncbi:MAG: tape measure protein [Psychrobacter sp.]
MSQTSRLSIVVDTSNAKQRLAEFTRQLNNVAQAARNMSTNVSNSLQSMGGGATTAGNNVRKLSGALREVGDLSTKSFSLATRAAGKLSPLLNTTAQSSRALSTSIRDVGASSRSLAPLTGSLSRLDSSLNNTNRGARSLYGTMNILNQTVNNTTVIINNMGGAANRAAGGLNNLGGSADRANRSARGLHGTMNKLYTVLNSGLVAVTGLGFIKTAAEMQNLNNQIRLVTDSEREYIGMKRLAGKIADENFADINATIGLYQKSARALENLGKSQADSIKFTEAVSLAMRTGGRSAGENAAAILQLGQAMGAGVIMGDEFRSISENAPVLLKLVAKEMGVLQGDLKKLSADGKITAEIMYNAMTKNMAELEELAKKMPLTMGQAFTVAKNRYKKYTDEMMNSTGGVSDKISGMLIKISDNFDTIAKVGIAAVSVGLLSIVANLATATNAMKLFNLVTSANPLIFLVSGFLLLTSAIYGTNEVLTISGLMVSDFFDEMGIMIDDAKSQWDELGDWIEEKMGTATEDIADANDKNAKNFLGFYKNTEEGFAGLVQTIGTLMAVIKTSFETAFDEIEWKLNNLSMTARNAVNSVYNSAQTAKEFFGFGEANIIPIVKTEEFDQLNTYKQNFSDNQDSVRGYAKDLNQRKDPPVPFGVYDPNAPLKQNMVNKNFFSVDMTRFMQKGVGAGFYARTAKFPTREENPYLYSNQASTNPINPQSKLAYETKKIRKEEEKRLENLEKLREEQEKQNKADKKKLKNLIPKAVSDAILAGAKELGVNPNDLAAVISFETGGTFSTNARNPTSSATGLIQFMDGSDGKNDKKYYGNTRDEFGSMLPLQQMDYVVKYLKERDIKAGDGVAELYDAVAGYGYKKGSAGYEGNKVWDVNKDGVVAKGEAVTGKLFKSHIKDYYGDGVSIAQESIASIYAAELKMAEEQQKKREALRKEYGTAAEVIASNLNAELREIETAGFDKEETRLLQEQAVRNANIELSTYQETLDRKIDALDAWHKTERDLLKDARNNAKFDALTDPELRKSENEEYLTYALKSADREFEHKTKLLNLSQEKEALGLFEYASTDRRMFEEGWRLKIAEAKLATDELKDIRIKAYKAEYAKDQELFNLNEKKKRLELNSYKMSDTESMVAGIALEREGIASSSATPEQKRERSQAAGQPIRDSLEGMLNNFDNSGTAEGNPYLAVEAQRSENLEKIKAYEQEIGLIEGDAREERLAAEREYYRAKTELVMNDGESIVSSMASIAKDTMGEQSSIFKAMFAMEKGFAIARSIMNIQVALSSAAASLPFPANLGAIATVAAEGASIISSLKAVAGTGFEKGGYTGSMGTKDIAGVVHGQEYVFDAQSTKRIGVDNLNAMRSGKSVGGGDVNISVNVDAKGNSSVQGDNERMGRDMANGIKAVVMDTLRKEKRQGGMLYA